MTPNPAGRTRTGCHATPSLEDSNVTRAVSSSPSIETARRVPSGAAPSAENSTPISMSEGRVMTWLQVARSVDRQSVTTSSPVLTRVSQPPGTAHVLSAHTPHAGSP
jgi:hypothetical protein